jgi:hypothetical protein
LERVALLASARAVLFAPRSAALILLPGRAGSMGGWLKRDLAALQLCLEALEGALARFGRPEIFNTDQGVCGTRNAFPVRANVSAMCPLWTKMKL